MSKEGVSIIICCYNSASRIGETLAHLSLQTLSKCPAWEIIVVNNNSTDNTGTMVLESANKLGIQNLKLIDEPKAGLMNARICGGKSAQYSILSFIDDDNRVEKQWIEKVFTLFKDHPEISVCGGSSSAQSDAELPSWFPAFSSAFAVGKQQTVSGYVIRERSYLWGAGISFTAEAWNFIRQNHAGFYLTGRKGKSLSAGEDSELCLLLLLKGKKIWYEENLKFIHFIPAERLSISYLTRIYSGFGASEVILRIYRCSLLEEQVKFTHEFRSAAKNYLLLSLKSVFLFYKSSNDLNKLKVSTAKSFYRSFLQTLINIRSEYNTIMNEIYRIKNR